MTLVRSKLAYALLALFLVLSSTIIFTNLTSNAASLTWDGGGDGVNFSDPLNWSSDTLPVTGDIVNFVHQNGGSVTLNNDLSGRIYGGINFVDYDPSSQFSSNITISSNNNTPLEVDGTITQGFGNNHAILDIDVTVHNNILIQIAAGGNVAINTGRTLNLNSGTFTVEGTNRTDEFSNSANIAGSGSYQLRSISLTALDGSLLNFNGYFGLNNSYYLPIYGTSGSFFANQNNILSLDNTTLYFNAPNGAIIQNRISTIGSNRLQAVNTSQINIPNNPTNNITLNGTIFINGGPLELGSDGIMTINGNIDVAAGQNANDISFMLGVDGSYVINSSSNNSSKPNGTYVSAPLVITFSNSVGNLNYPLYYNEIGLVRTDCTNGTLGSYVVHGATLKGTGCADNVTFDSTATYPVTAAYSLFSPGEDVGSFTVNGNLIMNDGKFRANIGGTAPSAFGNVIVNGSTTLASALEIVHVNSYVPSINDTFTIIDNGQAVSGAFSNIAEGGTLVVNGVEYTITYSGGTDGHDVVLTVTSVPSAGGQGTGTVTEVTDSQPSTPVTIAAGSTYVMKDGSRRGDITMNGGTLKGVGTVGNISLSGGTVAPGLSPGILNSGNFTATGGSFEVEIGGTTAGSGYDQLNVTGTVNLGSATTLSVVQWNNFVPAAGNSFTIINNDGSDAVSGTFSGLAQGASITVGGVVYVISYTGGDGNDVVLTVSSVSSAVTPSAPNTGFGMITSPITLTLLSLTLLGGMAVAYKKYAR